MGRPGTQKNSDVFDDVESSNNSVMHKGNDGNQSEVSYMVKGGGNIPSDMMSDASYIRKGNDDM